ncbi:hypothetical protein C8Q75DRAFT_777367 [Abortiporus biennis]|nr:hypothetical protein C8Q75DRAFT_777367 [Abortiporus biennis]
MRSDITGYHCALCPHCAIHLDRQPTSRSLHDTSVWESLEKGSNGGDQTQGTMAPNTNLWSSNPNQTTCTVFSNFRMG